MNQKPPRRNLPSPAEAWGRWVDNKIQVLENKLILSLKNLNAALAANTSSLTNLSYLTDTGWTDLPALTGGITSSRARWRRTGGMVTLDVATTGTFLVGETALYGAGVLDSQVYPDQNMWGTAFFSSGYSGPALIRSNGSVSVFQQTGASRTNGQFTIVYPAFRV